MEYKHWKWNNGGKNCKSYKKTVDMREQNIEMNMANECLDIMEAENKREICSKRLLERKQVVQSNKNPFLSNNNYLEDINNEMNFLRPVDSNYNS